MARRPLAPRRRLPRARGRAVEKRGNTLEQLKGVFEKAGLYKKELKPGLHLLRGNYATLMFEGGATLETVRDLMGHCSVTVTERYLFTGREARSLEGSGLPRLNTRKLRVQRGE